MQQDPKIILPITKQQSRTINDTKASGRYRHRLAIDAKLADRKLEQQLREVWDEQEIA